MIDIFTVGGTIDKVYFDALSTYQIGEPTVEQILLHAGTNVEHQITSLMSKDSLEMTDRDRESVAKAVAGSDTKRILITHGTDTLTQTADVLIDVALKQDKTVVLTGAMQPARMAQTDAVFNVGFAWACVQTMPRGVYIAMNGKIFDAGHVQKNRDAGRFEFA